MMNTRNRRLHAAGYSLVELMAFMLVMVTLAAFILPFTRGALNAMNLTSDARNVASAVSLAKMRAAATLYGSGPVPASSAANTSSAAESPAAHAFARASIPE